MSTLPKLGIFFSHPTQHHSVMFQHLAQDPSLVTSIYYYDPGSYGAMRDRDMGVTATWDVDVFSGTNSKVLANYLRGSSVSVLRQFNPAAVLECLRRRFDVVYLSGYVSMSNWMVLITARLMGAKVLYQSDTNVIEVRAKRHPLWQRALRGLFLRNVDHLLVIGNKNREAYEYFGLGRKRMSWCPYPFDARRYLSVLGDPEFPARVAELRQRYGIPADARIVTFCGKLIPRKRPTDFVLALRKVNEPDVYGLMIGTGEMHEDLKNMLGPGDRIRITGFVNQSEIPLHLASACVGVVSSEEDPHPLVTSEMAICGVPVIVSDQTGVWGANDVLRDGENGYVFRCGNIDDLARRISNVLRDSFRRERMGNRGRELARQQGADEVAKIIARTARDEFDGAN